MVFAPPRGTSDFASGPNASPRRIEQHEPAADELVDGIGRWFRAGKPIRRNAFLAEMDKGVPWEKLCACIEPFYPKPRAKGGRQPIGLERMQYRGQVHLCADLAGLGKTQLGSFRYAARGSVNWIGRKAAERAAEGGYRKSRMASAA